MNFFYNKGNNNFGDVVNDYFFEKLLNKKLIFTIDQSKEHYFVTGSILHLINENSIVCGSGFISQNSDIGTKNYHSNNNKVIHKPKKIISVRGPLTRNKLLLMNIECPENYGDPLLLFPLIYNNKNIQINVKIGIIPHFIDKECVKLKKLINSLGVNNIKIINIIRNNDYEEFINEILSCEYIISSSLHGIIMGIVYKRKTIFVQFSDKVIGDTFKFYDFFESLNIQYTIMNKYDESILNNVILFENDKLFNIGKNMVECAPFIDNKNELIEKYFNYVYDM